jgi:hypothetical protein
VCLQEEDGKQEREKRNKLFGTYGEKKRKKRGKKRNFLQIPLQLQELTDNMCWFIFNVI